MSIDNLNRLIGDYLDACSDKGVIFKHHFYKQAYLKHSGISYYHPFMVITPDGQKFPEHRAFKVVVAHRPGMTGDVFVYGLHPGEFSTDFGVICVTDIENEFEYAERAAKAFIDSKIAEVRQVQIPDTKQKTPKTVAFTPVIEAPPKPGDVLDIVIVRGAE